MRIERLHSIVSIRPLKEILINEAYNSAHKY